MVSDRAVRLAILLVCGLLLPIFSKELRAQSVAPPGRASTAKTAGLFLAGGAVGLGAHELGHVVFDLLFDADPGLKKVDFHGIPFFAITHRTGLSPRRELAISSAGFWVQHAGSEWLLTRRPRLRDEHAPLAKGVLAFNVFASMAYAGAAFAQTGPLERDTRGIAISAGIEEPWVGAIVLTPAVLDAWRYFHPEARWAVWTSRAAKVGMVLLLAK
jgi:hypothetical protein